MKTKKKIVIKKVVKKSNWKALGILVAIIIGITGYVLYKNSATTPEIFAVKNPIKGNGLEAEEAAYIKKTTVKEGLGTAPAPVVKVTVEKDGVEYSSNVSLKKKDEDNENTNDDNESGNNNVRDLAAQITNQVLTDNGQAPIVYDAGKPVAEPAAPAAGQSGAPGSTPGTGTCSTAGSPVLEGTWVSTGRVFDDKNPATDDSAQRECVKCGGAGKYEGSMSCSSAFQQGLPMVLPTGGGRPYTGTDIAVKPCYVKSGGSFVQVGAGYSADNAVCTPDGNMTSLSAKTEEGKSKVEELMGGYCAAVKAGQVFKDGKCQPSAPATTIVTGGNQGGCNVGKKDDETWVTECKDGKPVEKKCVGEGLDFDANGACRSADLMAKEEIAKKEAAALELAKKQLSSVGSKDFYPSSASCQAEIKGKSALECLVIPGGNGYYIAIHNTKLVACPMPNNKSQMQDFSNGKDCSSIPGSVAALAKANTDNPKGNLTGGETTKNLTDCRFGGSPSRGTGLNTEFTCNDYTGKVPAKTETAPAAANTGLTLAQKSKLNNPNSPWSATNPVLVKKESDCPENSNIDSVYLPNDTGETYRCTPKSTPAEGANTDTTSIIPPDAPGIVNYDTAGGVVGFFTRLSASAGVCSLPILLGGPVGFPASVACRWEAGIAGAIGGNKLGDYLYSKSTTSPTEPQVSQEPDAQASLTVKGNVKNGDKCSLPSECQTGYCAPSVFDGLSQRCEKPPTSANNQVSSNGKYLEKTTCKDSNQCEDDLFCMKRVIGGNTCEKIEKQTLKPTEQCTLIFAFGDEKTCDHCPNEYHFEDGKLYCN